MFSRMYLEITTCCNLSCSFCPGTKRPAAFLSPEDFRTLAAKLRPYGQYLYLHVMGEPLLHPAAAGAAGDLPGTRLPRDAHDKRDAAAKEAGGAARRAALRKVSISLHSFEANEAGDFSRLSDGLHGLCPSGKKIGHFDRFPPLESRRRADEGSARPERGDSGAAARGLSRRVAEKYVGLAAGGRCVRQLRRAL